MHHIVTDGWSIGVFVQELGAVYDDIRGGREPSLPELPIQYPDYAEWQRGWLQGETLERMLSYWRVVCRGPRVSSIFRRTTRVRSSPGIAARSSGS